MTEEITTPEPSELELLKQRADLMNVKYHTNIGVDKLKEKINEKMTGGTEAPVEDLDEAAQRRAKRMKLHKEASKLVRVRISCMNPMKKEWFGEIFTVSNSTVGTFRKFVPFGKIFHVPSIIFKMINRRKFQTFYTVKDERGNLVRKARKIKEFGIEKLPDLTKEELATLAAAQAARHSIDSDEG